MRAFLLFGWIVLAVTAVKAQILVDQQRFGTSPIPASQTGLHGPRDNAFVIYGGASPEPGSLLVIGTALTTLAARRHGLQDLSAPRKNLIVRRMHYVMRQ